MSASRELSSRLWRSSRKRVVGAMEAHVEARAAGDVPERVREKGLADADGPEDHDVAVRLDEAQARQLLQHTPIEADLGGLVPALEHHVGVEASIVGAARGRRAVPAL